MGTVPVCLHSCGSRRLADLPPKFCGYRYPYNFFSIFLLLYFPVKIFLLMSPLLKVPSTENGLCYCPLIPLGSWVGGFILFSTSGLTPLIIVPIDFFRWRKSHRDEREGPGPGRQYLRGIRTGARRFRTDRTIATYRDRWKYQTAALSHSLVCIYTIFFMTAVAQLGDGRSSMWVTAVAQLGDGRSSIGWRP